MSIIKEFLDKSITEKISIVLLFIAFFMVIRIIINLLFSNTFNNTFYFMEWILCGLIYLLLSYLYYKHNINNIINKSVI